MTKLHQPFLLLLLFFMPTFLLAQLEVTSGDTPPFEPETILENYFFGGGVEVLEIEYTGAPGAVGFFDGENSNLDIDRGIILTTGAAINAEGPNTNTGVTSANNLSGDPDLTQLINGIPTNDATIYNIKFIPFDTIVRFNYVWASDEYPEFAPPNMATFNDVFGFFISGPDINGPFSNNSENIAFLPDGITPVSINNVNAVTNNSYYVANNQNSVEYDGFTVPLQASAKVTPCEIYDIKIAVADGGSNDYVYDSAVFLASGSFGTDALNISVNTISPDSIMVEGCVASTIEFKLGNPTEEDLFIDYDIWGTAVNGTDYDFVPPNAFIPAGEDSISLVFNSIEDGITEGLEAIYIEVQTNICTIDTFAIYINDDQLVAPTLPNATICSGESVTMDATLPIPLPPSTTFTNNNSQEIPDNDPTNPLTSTIEVIGAVPEQYTEGSILSVCVDITHPYVGDLDIYLISPSGLFLNLSSDNGGSGDNYEQACFTLDASTIIEGLFANSTPFTGEYLPESPWDDLLGADINGTWTLQVSDDSNLFTGTLNSWSITLPPIYRIGYQWTPDTGVSDPFSPMPSLSPTETTTYTVTATDTYGCSVFANTTITVIPTVDAPIITCDNSIDGEITFSWGNIAGVTGFEINVNNTGWTAVFGLISTTISGLNDGEIVSIEVRGTTNDICGFTQTGTLQCTAVNQACDLLATLDSQNNVTCNGDADGEIVISTTGGTTPITFELDGATQNTGTFSSLSGGTYTINISDANGCTTTQTVTIIEPDVFALSPSISNATCNDASDGSLTLNPVGGTPDYMYSMDGISFQNLNTFDGLSQGTYIFTALDANNCLATANVDIGAPAPLVASTSGDNAGCTGNDGEANASATGGTSPYSFLWSNGETTAAITDLTPDTYTVTVTDANNCTATSQIDIGTSTDLMLGVSITDISCNGANDGSGIILPQGVSPFSYLWDANAGAQTTSQASNLAPGEYFVTVTDANGCIAETSVTITEPPALNLTIEGTDLSCANEPTGSATIYASGGTGAYTYEWSDLASQMDSIAINLLAGTYTVTVTDERACTETASITINQPTDALTLSATGSQVDCFGDENGIIIITGDGGTPPYEYSQDGINFQTSNIFYGLAADEYNVYVRDATGICIATETVSVTEPPELTVELGDDLELEYGDSILLDPIINQSGNFTYQWSTFAQDTSLTCFDCATPFAYPSSQVAYNLIVTDENGCRTEDDIRIFVTKTQSVFIANAFTPNGDTYNDVLYVQGGENTASVVVFQVYDRWGELVFESRNHDLNDPIFGWDGTQNGQEMNPGVFVWYAEVQLLDGSILNYKGNTTLIR